MRRPPVPRRERGAALLAVLLLVAVTGAIAATALEKMSLSRAMAVNTVALDQARAYANAVEQLALLTIDDLIVESPERTTLAGGWNGAVRRVALPEGGVAAVRVRDGGNCFNVNSVVEGDPRTGLTRRQAGVVQLTGLMMALEVPETEARRIAEAAADWVDSDVRPGPAGAEDAFYSGGAAPYRTANTLFADVGELAALAGMTPEVMARLRPWLCALPSTELSPININTLLPDQAPLLAMLAPGQLDVARARRVLASRPPDGWGSQVEFWRIDAMRDVNVPLDV
ncbi:MAG: type II secretion system minor pseudopilin GspK, partial [Allosphingosinicella sp.]